MENNISLADCQSVSDFLLRSGNIPKLTNGAEVRQFEQEFAYWLGTKYAVMVNSGASANLITMQALRLLAGAGHVLVPCITWVSDIVSVLKAEMEPQFVDINLETLGMDYVSGDSLAAFVTHCLGFRSDIPQNTIAIEDCCEAIGARGDAGKLGTTGLMSNFSFYYGHHMTTIEGGMVCTNDDHCDSLLRMLRSHGLVRECPSLKFRSNSRLANPDLDPEFIFEVPGYNVRPTEINAVIGRSQLRRLDVNNIRRTENLCLFLSSLDSSKYRTSYRIQGSSNFALPLILTEPNREFMSRVVDCMSRLNVEFRRGTAGGGNQLRQPYARRRWGDHYRDFPNAEHVHQFGLYVGNMPTLEHSKIERLCAELNSL